MAWSQTLSPRANIVGIRPFVQRLSYFIFAFALLVRLVTLLRLASSPFLLPNGGDTYFYDAWARRILHGQFTDGFAFYGLPLYAYLLACFYKLFGDSPFVPGLVQACLDAGTATLLYKIAFRVFRDDSESFSSRGNVIGYLAAAGWTFFVPAQAYSVILMPTVWFVFVFWFLVWQVVKSDQAPGFVKSFAFGTLIGITAMGLATILVILPIILIAVLLRPWADSQVSSAWAARGICVVLLFLGVGVGTAPCWIHNYFVARDPVFLSAHSGINFWLGNNPQATGYPHFPGLRAGQEAMLKDSIDLAESATGRSLKRSEVSNYWSTNARAYIAHNFDAWLKLLGKKLVNFWNAFEYDDINVIDKLRYGGVVPPGVHFGIVAALALPGLCLSIRKFPAVRWIVIAILLPMCGVLSIFITERYRLAVAPGLLLFAAAGLWMFWRSLALTHSYVAVCYLAILATGVAFITWPQRDPAPWALKFYNSGLQSLDNQDWTSALKNLELAHAYAQDSTEVNLALGNLWLERQNLPLAKGYYSAVLQTDSRHRAALNNLGVVSLSGRDWEGAANYFRSALILDPSDSKAHYLYARAQFEAGHVNEALSEIQIAIRLRPGQHEFEELYELIQRQP